MDYSIKQLSIEHLEEYQSIPMIKKFSSLITFDEQNNLKETPVKKQEIDLAAEEDINEWKQLFPINTSGIFVLTKDEKMIAGVIVLTHAPKIHLLENNLDNAILWDIRIDPQYQGLGLGKKLFNLACDYAKNQQCKALIIETQNNNPKAIKFYQHMGASLYKTKEHAYPEQPDEVQILFKKELS